MQNQMESERPREPHLHPEGRGRVAALLIAAIILGSWLWWSENTRVRSQPAPPLGGEGPLARAPSVPARDGDPAPAAPKDPDDVQAVWPEKEWKPPVFTQGVRVHVTEMGGRPIVGATVRLEYGGAGRLACDLETGNKYDQWPAFLKTDDRGEALFRLPYNKTREPTLEVCAEGFAAAKAHVSTVPEGVFVDVVVPLEAGWILQGWVRGVDKADLPDIEVKCHPNPGFPEVEDPALRELIDKEGPYKELSTNDWMDQITKYWESHPQKRAPDHDYEVQEKRYSYSPVSLTLDEEGGFRFPCAPRSGISLSVTHQFGRYKSARVEVPPNSPPVTVRCSRDPNRTLGRVTIVFPPDHPGSMYGVSFRPLDPMKSLRSPEKYDLWHRAYYRHSSYPFTEPLPGNPFDFDIPQQVWLVPPGAWAVTVTGRPPPPQWPKAPHQNELATFTVTVEKDGEYRIDPEFHRGAQITGKVLDAGTGEGIYQARVTLVDPAAGAQSGSATAVTGPDGAFILIGLKPGKWEFAFKAGQYDEVRETLVADPDAPTTGVTVKLNLHVEKPKPGTIMGQVIDAGSGAPIPWASLALEAKTPQLNQSLSGTSGPNGSFQLLKVQPGRWKLVVSAKAYQTAEEWVTSSEAAPTEGVIVRLYRQP